MTARQRTRSLVRRRVGASGSHGFGGAILNSVESHIAVLDREGEIVAVNAAWREFAIDNGLESDQLDFRAGVGANYLDVCRCAAANSDESARDALVGIQNVLQGRSDSYTLEYPCHSAEAERWFALTVTPLAAKGFCGAVVLHADVTARKLAEIKRLETEQRLATEFADLKRFHEISMRSVSRDDVQTTLRDIVSLAVNATHADMGTFLLLNQETGNLELKAQVGFAPEFIISGFRFDTSRLDSASAQALHTKRQVVVPDISGSGLFEGSPLLEPLRVLGAKATISTPLVSRAGQVLGTLSLLFRRYVQPSDSSLRRLDLMARQAADLIERFDFERALRRSEQRFVEFVRHFPAPAWIKDSTGKYVDINESAARYLGKPRSEVCGHRDEEMLRPEDAERLRKNDLLVLASGAHMQFTETLELADGSHQFFLVNKFPIPGSAGEPSLVGGMSIDITDRKRTEELLRQIIEALSPTTGNDFFRAVAVQLTRACQVDFAFVAEFGKANLSSAQTIAVARDGVLVDNFEVDSSDSLGDLEFSHTPNSASECFADDKTIASWKIDSCMRIVLKSSAGSPIGLIALMHRRPIAQPERAESLLRIVATRAAAELERERAEAALRANEIRLQTVLDHATDALFLHDAETRVIDVNRQACDSLGYTREELVGMLPPQFDPHAEHGLSDWAVARLDAGEAISFDSQHRRKDGSLFPVEVRIRPFWIDGKRYGLSLARDITDRKRAEEALRSAKSRLSQILEHANVGLWEWDLTTDEVIFSREWKSQIGFEEHEISNRFEEWQSRVHPDDITQTLAALHETIRRGDGVYEVEFRFQHKDGSWRWILARGRLTGETGCPPTRMAGIHIDTTDRKRVDGALRSQLRVLERIATGEPLPEILEEIVSLVEGQLTESRCAVLLLNEDETKLHFGAGKNLPSSYRTAIDGIDIVPNETPCGAAAYLKETVIVYDIAADPVWTNYQQLALGLGLRSCWLAPIFTGGGKNRGSSDTVLGTFALYNRVPTQPSGADVQILSAAANLAGIAIERHRAEATIRDNEDRLRTLLENLQNVAVQAYESDGTITFWNKLSERVYGYSADEALGKDIVELVYPEASRERERQTMADAIGGGLLPEQVEHEVLRPDGAKLTVLSSRVLHQRTGRPPEFFCFVVDVTDKKRAEEELALRQLELAHASRLSTLGQMVAALSHEVAQPLTAIGNYASASFHLLNRMAPPPPERINDYIRAITLQNQRCMAILQRLRDFSRRGQPRRSSCDILQLVNTSVALVANELRRQNVSVKTHITQNLPPIAADQVQLQQVIVNLITNACDAVRDQPESRRKIVIRAGRSGHECTLSVEDSGPGFSQDAGPRLFEAFFTTKAEGLGIGLNICESIVRSHGGEIGAAINQKGGATFSIRLPFSEDVG